MSTHVEFRVCNGNNHSSSDLPDGLLESTLETMKAVYSKLSLSAVEFPTASKKVSVTGFVCDISMLILI